MAKGAGWLETHPERDFIVNRALKRRRRLVREALARLAPEEAEDDADTPDSKDAAEAALKRPIRLNDLRMARVAEVLAAGGARRVVDLGCGEGRLLRELMANRQFEQIVGVDTALGSLERAAQRLKLEHLPERQAARLKLLHGALTYRDRRLAGCDAAALVEVIEHVDPDRHLALERAVFEFMAPGMVVVTTPNREYNVLFEGIPSGALRHRDHRFEWTRAELESWSRDVAARFGTLCAWRASARSMPSTARPRRWRSSRR